jgi:YD repeat-containing protein
MGSRSDSGAHCGAQGGKEAWDRPPTWQVHAIRTTRAGARYSCPAPTRRFTQLRRGGGSLLRGGTATGQLTRTDHDLLGRTTQTVQQPDTDLQRTTTYQFDVVGNLQQQTDALGRVTRYGYDTLNRRVSVTEASGMSVQRTTSTQYDANDNVVQVTDALGTVAQTTYDRYNRPTLFVEAAGTALARSRSVSYGSRQ